MNTPFEAVASVAVVEAPAVWCSVVGEEHETSMVRLRHVGEEIKQRVVIEEEVLRVALLRADNIGALNGVAAEKDWLQRKSEAAYMIVPNR